MWQVVREIGQVHTGFWWRDLRGRDNKKDRGVDGKILQWIFKKWDGEV